jgi:hypothetical protein
MRLRQRTGTTCARTYWWHIRSYQEPRLQRGPAIVATAKVDKRWTTGVLHAESDGSRALFAEIRAYKNDNTHFKLNQNFVRALNIEAARLLGWIKSPQEASVQMGITIEQATERFGTNIQLLKAPLLLG